MSDEYTTPPEHEEIARLLAQHGPVDAPPDLAANVMRQVHEEPRRARRLTLLPSPRRLRPALAYCAAAAVLVAVGFGVAHLGSGGSSSSGGVAGDALAPGVEKSPTAMGGGAAGATAETIANVPYAAAQRYLPMRTAPGLPLDSSASGQIDIVRVNVSAATFDALSRKLHAAAARSTSGHRITIVLRRR
jgi:hypothetical protein